MDKLTELLRANYHKYTREPRGGQELEWQRKLLELDSNLSIRRNLLHQHWSVYYSRHGRPNIIKTFTRPDEFGKMYLFLKREGAKTKRDRILEHDRNQDHNKKLEDKRIAECGEEMGREIHKMTRNKVTNDSVKVGNY